MSKKDDFLNFLQKKVSSKNQKNGLKIDNFRLENAAKT